MSGAPPTDRMVDLDDWLMAHADELVAFRRHLHANPEVSGREVETTRYVAERLAVAGLEPRILPGGTGLVCDVVGDGAGRTVMLRADLDALAMDDEKDVPYRSRRAGVAHACGHDVHTTAVLGAGLALRELLTARFAGRVRLVFQPAEEQVPGGALDVIAAGALRDVDLVLGLHCDPRLEVGRVGLRPGAITSAADMLTVVLHGPGGHTARPHQTVDLVALAASLVADLPAEVTRRLGGRTAHIVFGTIHAGDAANVIPSRAELRGTIRTPEPEIWSKVESVVREALVALVSHTEARMDIEYHRGHPPVVNDEHAASLVASAALAQLGSDAVRDTAQSVGGDDFSWYLAHAPGCYTRLGVRDPDAVGTPIDLHASHFDVDERCIPVGIRVLVEAAARALADN